MEYFSGVYWQQGDGMTSLVLKQLVYQKSGVPVLFGCMQSCDEAWVTEALMEWFYEEGIYLCGRKGMEPEMLEYALQKGIYKILRGRQNVNFTVFLCAEDSFCVWNKGMQKVYLLNTRFGNPCTRCITAEEGENVFTGRLHQNVGILVVTRDLCEVFTEEQIRECLAVKELCSAMRVQKRVDELGRKACQLGGRHVGIMLAVTG